MDPTEAKKQAQKIKDKKEAEASQKKTFEEVARDWLDTPGKGRSERYLDNLRYRLEGDILSCLGGRCFRAASESGRFIRTGQRAAFYRARVHDWQKHLFDSRDRAAGHSPLFWILRIHKTVGRVLDLAPSALT